MADKPPLIEFRCPNDGRLLLKVSETSGLEVEVRCPKCKSIVRAELSPDPEPTS